MGEHGRWGLLRSPWPPLVAGLGVVAVAVAFAAFEMALLVCGLATAALLVWKYGPREGLWYLLIASMPFHELLTVEIHGTVSIYLTDVLLFGLFAEAAYRGEVKRVWRSSPTLKVGLAVLLLSVPGLFTATRVFWGIASVYRIALQIALFIVALSIVRTGRQATRTFVALLLGLAPAVAYGLYQASLPFGAEVPEWSKQQITYGEHGERNLRIFSTFDNPLRFSHYLTTGLAVSLGLAFSDLKRLWRGLLLVIGAAAAYCNMFTYSVAGTVGMLTALGSTAVLSRRRAIVLVPLLVLPLVLVSPGALVRKASRVLTGDAYTVAGRLITYQQGITVMLDHPLTGVGWGSMRSSLEHDYRLTRAYGVGFGVENYFLHRGAALGLPGMALYVALCIMFFRNVKIARASPRSASWPSAVVLIGGIALYVQGQSFPMANATSNYLLWLMLAMAEQMRAYATTDTGAGAGPAEGAQ